MTKIIGFRNRLVSFGIEILATVGAILYVTLITGLIILGLS